MRKLIVILALLAASCGALRPASAPTAPMDRLDTAVQAIQFKGQTFCTAFSVNERAGYWVTAAHCAKYASELWQEQGVPVTIDRQNAVVIYTDPTWDVAVLVGSHVAGLPLALRPPAVGDAIQIVGYPYGLIRARTYGYLAARDLVLVHPVTERPIPSDFLDITTAGGNSGSPVLNANGAVVGVLWGGFGESPHALSVPWETLSAVLFRYWE